MFAELNTWYCIQFDDVPLIYLLYFFANFISSIFLCSLIFDILLEVDS